MAESYSVEAVLKATGADKFARAFQGASGNVSKFQGTAMSALKGVAVVAASAAAVASVALGGLAIKGTKDFIAFEGQMNEVFTLLPNISGKAMGEMSEQVSNFSKEFGVLPEKTVPALYSAISAGVPKENVFTFLETAQKAAVGGVTELETAVDGISSVVNAYGDDVIGAGEASDLMFTAVKKGKTNFEELSNSLFQVIPTASSLGVEFGDVTAALATMTAQGTPTNVATTQMRQALVELSKEGGSTSDTFKDLAGKSFKDFVAEGGNVQGAMQLLEGHAEDTGVGVNDLFGSVEAGNAALALTGKGTESFSENLEAMSNSTGATDAAFNTMEQGIGRSIAKIKANIAVMSKDIGKKLGPTVKKLADKFIEYMPVIQSAVETAMDKVSAAFDLIINSTLVTSAVELFNTIKEKATELGESSAWQTITDAFGRVAQAILDLDLTKLVEDIKTGKDAVVEFLDKWSPLIAGILIGVGVFKGLVFVSGMLSAISAAGGILAIVMGGLAATTSVLAGAVAFLTSPFFLVAAAIAAVIAIGVLLYKNWDTIKEKATEIWGAIATWFSQIGSRIKESFIEDWNQILAFFKEIGARIKTAFMEDWNAIKKFFTETMVGIWNVVKTYFTNIANSVRNKLSDAKNNVVNKFNEIKNTISSKVSEAYNVVRSKFQEIANIIRTKITEAKNNVVNKFNEIKSTITSKVSEAVTTVRIKFNEIVNAIREKMNDAVDKVKDIGGGFKSFFDNIDLYASGKAIIQSAIDGIVNMKSKITDKVSEVAGAVRDFWPFSPAKEGPLKDINKMDFSGPIGDSIDKAKRPVEKSMRGLASAANNSFDINGSIMRSNGQVSRTISHEVNANSATQPMNLNLSIGGHSFTAFVENVTNTQNKSIRLETEYGL